MCLTGCSNPDPPSDAGPAAPCAGPEETQTTFKVFLTFDDGTEPGTDDVLRILSSEGKLKATFFLLGHHYDDPREGAGRLRWNIRHLGQTITDGHMIGNHSYIHEYLYGAPVQMVATMTRNVTTVSAACSSAGVTYPSEFEQVARLPGSNCWRVGSIVADVTTRGHTTNATADRLVGQRYTIYGWDDEWHFSDDPALTKAEKAVSLRQTPVQMAASILGKLRTGGNSLKKPNKLILLAHDRQFKHSKGNDVKLGQMIQELKRAPENITFHTLRDY